MYLLISDLGYAGCLSKNANDASFANIKLYLLFPFDKQKVNSACLESYIDLMLIIFW